MTYSSACECDNCKHELDEGSDIYCIYCFEDKDKTIAELREIICRLEEALDAKSH